jgi:hypothetical protein
MAFEDRLPVGRLSHRGARLITYSILDIGSGLDDAFRFNRLTGKTSKVSIGIGPYDGAIVDDMSPDGRFLLITADHEVGTQSCRETDVWVRDMKARSSTRVTDPTTGCSNAANRAVSISSDGRIVTFTSRLSRFTTGDNNQASDVFRRNVHTTTTVRISVASSGSTLATASSGGSMSRLGAWVVFTNQSAVSPGDTNSQADVYSRGPLP